MSIETIRIPQLGEGLQEALLVEYLLQPGDSVRRDQPLYVLETDKATTEVESPFDGEVVAWLVEPGVVLEIGTEIGQLKRADGQASDESRAGGAELPDKIEAGDVAGLELDDSEASGCSQSDCPISECQASDVICDESEDGEAEDGELRLKILPLRPSGPTSLSAGAEVGGGDASLRNGLVISRANGNREVRVPPRTRKHLSELGLADWVDQIPASGDKLSVEDVDRFVHERVGETSEGLVFPLQASKSAGRLARGFSEAPVPRQQLTLNYRLQRGLQQVVPATAVIEVEWSGLQEAREQNRAEQGPTGFMMMLWCVAKALAESPKFRSTLVQDGRVLRTFQHVHLGVAVALPDDSLVTAVIPEADLLTPDEFWSVASERIAAGRAGQDQASEQVTFTVSNVGTFGLDMGLPVVVPPAVATMALGKVEPRPVADGDSWRFVPRASLALTFDHRIVNGLGAGQFLSRLKTEIEAFSWPLVQVSAFANRSAS